MSKKPKMTAEQKLEVCGTVDQEGFDYTFQHYSSFEEIKDPQFHKLRQDYLLAALKLANYIGLGED